jgi:hypothetical protein
MFTISSHVHPTLHNCICVQDVHKRLKALGGHLHDYGPEVVRMAQLQPAQPEIEPYLAYYAEDRVKLNDEQQVIFDHVQSHLSPNESSTHMRIVHLEAAAGSGKTFLCLCMAMAVRGDAKSARCTAFTAKAASNYPGGHTAHYEFQLNVTNIGQTPSTRLVTSEAFRNPGAFASYAHSLCISDMHTRQLFASVHNPAPFLHSAA